MTVTYWKTWRRLSAATSIRRRRAGWRPTLPHAERVQKNTGLFVRSGRISVRLPGVRNASDEYARGPRRRLAGRLFTGRPAVQFALAAALAAVAFLGGYTLAGGGSSMREVAALREEVHALGGLLTVSLLHQESASERLKGVSYSEKLAASDPAITRALIATMNNDRSVNVRLAALDALSRELADPSVRHGVIQALPAQTSPLMQIALVDLLVQLNDQESREVLKAMAGRPGLVPEVRKRIEEGTHSFTDHAKVTS